MLLLAATFTFLLVLEVYCQPGGIIRSVSTYTNLANSPLSTTSTDTFTSTENIIAIRVALPFDSANGVNLLAFSFDTVPPPGSTYSFPDGSKDINSCQGVARGTSCGILQNKFILSFESTRLFARQQIFLRGQEESIPYAYQLFSRPNLFKDCTGSGCDNLQTQLTTGNPNNHPFYATTMPCGAINNINGFLSVDPNTDASNALPSGLNPVCPEKLATDSANQFYDPPSLEYVNTGSPCSLMYCAIPGVNQKDKPTWTLNTPILPSPMCTLGDLDPTPSALMMASVFITTQSYDNQNDALVERIDVSTAEGTILKQAATAPVAVTINTINTGIGVPGNVNPGMVVMCGVAGNANSEPLDDMPARSNNSATRTIRDLLYNPWSDTNIDSTTQTSKNINQRCTYPVSACRRLFLPKNYTDALGGEVGWWYYEALSGLQGYGTGCNQNGIGPIGFSKPSVISSFCASQAENPLSGVGTKCIPGYSQPADRGQALGTDRTTQTPCGVNQIYSTLLDDSGASASPASNVNVPGSDRQSNLNPQFVPTDWNPARPNYWISRNSFISEALGGTGSGGTLDMTIYVGGNFLGSIKSVTSGLFTAKGMSCDATQSGGGSVSFTTENAGRLPGDFVVVPEFLFDDNGGSYANIGWENIPSFTFTTRDGVKTVRAVSGSWGPQGSPEAVRNGFFGYKYDGPLLNSLKVRLRLFIPIPGSLPTSTAYTQVDEVTTGCTISVGVVNGKIARQVIPNGTAQEFQRVQIICPHWFTWAGLCDAHYVHAWQMFTWFAVMIALGLTTIAALVSIVIGAFAIPFIHPKKIKVDADSFSNSSNENSIENDADQFGQPVPLY